MGILGLLDATGSGNYAVGALVIVSANTPPEGSQFAG
jgi:hypothetical protein